jgi:hypothetical protein
MSQNVELASSWESRINATLSNASPNAIGYCAPTRSASLPAADATSMSSTVIGRNVAPALTAE